MKPKWAAWTVRNAIRLVQIKYLLSRDIPCILRWRWTTPIPEASAGDWMNKPSSPERSVDLVVSSEERLMDEGNRRSVERLESEWQGEKRCALRKIPIPTKKIEMSFVWRINSTRRHLQYSTQLHGQTIGDDFPRSAPPIRQCADDFCRTSWWCAGQLLIKGVWLLSCLLFRSITWRL